MKWIKKVAETPLNAVAKVIDTLQTQTNERTNAPSIRAVNEGLAEKWADIYPIGSIYMSVNNNDPSLIFGGTWQQIKDKFLLASGDTYSQGTTGGVASNSYTPAGTVGNTTLTINQIPSHTHEYGTIGGSGSGVVTGQGFTGQTGNTGATGGGQPHNHSFSGTPTTFNNMPPYLAVNVWVRTA